jgi:hypothetical protein
MPPEFENATRRHLDTPLMLVPWCHSLAGLTNTRMVRQGTTPSANKLDDESCMMPSAPGHFGIRSKLIVCGQGYYNTVTYGASLLYI